MRLDGLTGVFSRLLSLLSDGLGSVTLTTALMDLLVPVIFFQRLYFWPHLWQLTQSTEESLAVALGVLVNLVKVVAVIKDNV